MPKNLRIDLAELVDAKIIAEDTAQKIEAFYKTKQSSPENKLFVLFSILGAILVGAGVILIIAHNWDELPRFSKVIFAFMPLVIAQFLCVYTLLKKKGNIAWSESVSVLCFFTVGACISLVGQIYNLYGNFPLFLLTCRLD